MELVLLAGLGVEYQHGGGESQLSSVASLSALTSALQVSLPASSVASHGSWTKHEYKVTDPSPCCYKGWSRTGAQNTFNKGVAIFQLWYADGSDIIVHREVTCSGGGCGPTLKTGEYNWSQGSPQKYVRYFGCAKAGSHELGGNQVIGACVYMGLYAHYHKSGDFS